MGLLYGLNATAEMQLSKINKSDADSFRIAMHSVRPLKPDDRHRDSAPRKTLITQKKNSNEIEIASSGPRADSSFREMVADAVQQARPLLKDGLPRRYLRQLGGRDCPVADSLDLHGMTESGAAQVLTRFLNESLQHDLTCIRVVHGKGLRSEGPPVLKLMSWQLLWQHPAVLALKACAPVDGGSGAVLVLLQSSRKSAS